MLDLLVAATTTTGIKNPLPETRELPIYPEFVNICYKNADDTLGGWDNLETHQKLMVEANCFCKYYHLNTGEPPVLVTQQQYVQAGLKCLQEFSDDPIAAVGKYIVERIDYLKNLNAD